MDPILGQIQLFSFNFVPHGWRFCDGATLPINEHIALFSLLGTNFGGNGQTTFALPNLKGKEPIPDTIYCIAMKGTFPARD